MLMKALFSSAVVLTAMASPSLAVPLNGTFTINIRNFTDSDPGPDVTQTNSAATPANVAAVGIDATLTYTGDLWFGIGAGNSGSTTIWDFLATGGGLISGVDAAEMNFLQNTLLSQGSYVTTTFFEIFGTFATDALTGSTITHDDGITLIGNNVTGGVSAPPTSQRTTAFTADSGDFTLLYAAANGNPSILRVDANLAPVPLPAGGLLLLGALGGFAVLRRRKAA